MPACPPETETWARACAASAGLDVGLRSCRADGLVVDVRGPDGELLIDVTHARPGAFRQAGELALEPVGDFASWQDQPASWRAALDAVTACVQREAPPFQARSSIAAPDDVSVGVPWVLVALLASLLCRGVLFVRHRRAAPLSDVGIPAGVVLATFAVRWLALPRAFFHQNGQGPAWVDVAWRGVWSEYGPGFAEVYGSLARRSPTAPEGVVFVVNALLGACAPALGFVLARQVSRSRPVAAAVAVALACAPIAARLAQSESYVVPVTTLLFVAAMAFADVARLPERSAELPVSLAVATLAIAQAVRIHPIGWVPAGTTALVVLAGGWPRGGARRLAMVVVVAGLGVLVLSGRAMGIVLHGLVGQLWMPSAGRHIGQAALFILVWLALLAVTLLRPLRSRGLTRVALLVLAAGIAVSTNLVQADTAAVQAAYAALYAPVAVALVAGLVQRGPGTVPAVAIATAGLVLALGTAHATLVLPTDAREQEWALGWRSSIPTSALVCWYGHAGRRMLDLPLYRHAEMPRAMRLEEQGTTPAVPAGAYYVHTSLCSTEEGRAQCEAFERTRHLVAVERRTLPAIESLAWLPFPSDTVEVVLYRLGGDGE